MHRKTLGFTRVWCEFPSLEWSGSGVLWADVKPYPNLREGVFALVQFLCVYRWGSLSESVFLALKRELHPATDLPCCAFPTVALVVVRSSSSVSQGWASPVCFLDYQNPSS